MAWTTPTSRSTGYLVTASVYDTEIIANLQYLHGDGGATIDISAGGQLLKTNSVTSGPLANTLPSATPTGTLLTAGAQINFAAAAGTLFLAAGINNNTDTQFRFGITGDGTESWGTGALARDTTLGRTAAGQLAVGSKIIEGNPAASGVSVPATFTPNVGTGPMQRVNVTAGGAAALTIAAPTNPPSASQSAFLVVQINNTGGGTITLAWNAAYLSGNTLTLPANLATAKVTDVLFAWDGANWRIVSIG